MKLPAFFSKKTTPQKDMLTFSIVGMHCVACALNIDSAIEELPGVISSSTNYAKATTVVQGDFSKISTAAILQTIKDAGYEAVLVK